MTHYIYIPGFGDRFNALRRIALKRWAGGVTIVPMYWSDKDETYQQKYERIIEAMDGIAAEDVQLVGESAGGAMAMYVFSRHTERIASVTTLCGYNHGAEEIVQFQRRRHPAFYPLLQRVDRIVENLSPDMRQRITTIYSSRDHVVTPPHTRIEGTREVAMSIPGHIVSIGYFLARGLRRLVE